MEIKKTSFYSNRKDTYTLIALANWAKSYSTQLNPSMLLHALQGTYKTPTSMTFIVSEPVPKKLELSYGLKDTKFL